MRSPRGNLVSMDAVVDPNAPKLPPGQDELPYDDGEPMETARHRDQMNLLITTLSEHWPERRDVYVGGNMFVYFSELQWKGEKFRGPDVFVVLDTDRTKERKSWVAWEEGGRLPDVVIELLSESTAALDRGEKKRVYERIWRTGHYVVFDPFEKTLEGFELVANRYVPIAPNARGDLPIRSLGLSLGVRDGVYRAERGDWLRWLDAEGNPIPTGAERADEERARADAAEKRIAELEAALRERG